ncbi:amino acid deaminase/aldolase [Knoellia sinensis]|nr:amino acid deaminase/aldolase [Knoellia sinensis]
MEARALPLERGRFEELAAATAHLDAPYAVVDLDAFEANAADLERRAGGKRIRLASKSVRCRSLMRDVLGRPGWHGVLAFTLPEALWLAREVDDVVVGYPSVNREALRALASDEDLAARITLMVDGVEQLDFIESVVGGVGRGPKVRVCLDLDASLRLASGRVHLGPRRSPLHTADDARRMALAVRGRPRFRLVGLMSYEGQIAGLGDDAPGLRRFAVRAVQALSERSLREQRGAMVLAVRGVADLEFVNGGGTGSLEFTSSDASVTELAAGSGLLAPALFDTYRHFQPSPASFFALPVVRRPSPDHATLLGGGWIASGPSGADRLPTPVWPEGLSLLGAEGAGEVQTPVTGPGVRDLRVGDLVWLRHAKAGELSEHVDALHLVRGDLVVDTVPTYRGEAQTFL